ncbi:hypothetical protein AJ78_04443 [Emergomyces pasteurianus Ep9510]|uniref:Uncharacterized protein n=1 Tax=Emergomyces pasteurianus Ep9510 TaxID=1447872 RepID=A0A1J9PH12_9EURO|nr:hypothetical protein AJ78_04443 [Emergomyces pasteurianus Ep9510]
MTFELGIPSILEALLRVPPDLLRAHRMDVIPALETIAERVGVTVIQNYSCSPCQQVPTTFHTSHTPINNELLQNTAGTLDRYGDRSFQHYTTPSPTSRDENSCLEDATQLTTDDVLADSSNSNSSPSLRPQQLLQKIQKKLDDISQFSKNSSQDIVEGFFEHLQSEDPRIGHIKSITGKNKPTPEERFIQYLAQRSLALEFNQWENNVQGEGNTRLDDLSRMLSSANDKNGNFTLYVERFSDPKSAYQALRRGTKQLVLEKMCKTSGLGVAVPFAYGFFDALTYENIHDFPPLLNGQPNILHTLQNASSWVEASQSVYNVLWKNEQPQSSSPPAKRRRLISQPRVLREIRPRFSGGTAARELNDMQNSSSAPYTRPLEGNLPQDQTEDFPTSSQPPYRINSTSTRRDDAQSLPKDHISTNDPAQHTSVNQSASPTSSISESVDISPYYSCPGGSGAVACHNDSLSKQVCNGRQLSPIGELSLEEREAAQMLQQFQQSTSDPTRSQQLGEVSVRDATRESSQAVNANGAESDIDVPSHVPRPVVDISRQDLVRWEDDGTIHSSDLSKDHTSTNDPTNLNANESRPPHPATNSNLFYNGETTTNIPTWHNVVFDPDTQDMTNEVSQNVFYGLDTHNSTNGLWQDGFFDPDTQHPTNGLWRNVLALETSSNDSMGFRQLLPQFFPYCGDLDA